MAMTLSGNHGSRSYSYTVTETYTLEEAIEKASQGGFNPSEVYCQAPQELQQKIDTLSKKKFSKSFSELSISQQQEVMEMLLNEIKKIKEAPKKPLTIIDILKIAKEGHVDANKIYEGLPAELQRILDGAGMGIAGKTFCNADQKTKCKIIEIIIDEHEKRITLIKEKRKKSKQCILCGEPLGLINRAFRREKHKKCLEWKE